MPEGGTNTVWSSRALDFSVEYAGVTIFGLVGVVEDPTEAKVALQNLLDKYTPHLHPGQDYEAATDADLRRTAVYRLDIESWSGKRKVALDDHPGAVRYRSPSALE